MFRGRCRVLFDLDIGCLGTRDDKFICEEFLDRVEKNEERLPASSNRGEEGPFCDSIAVVDALINRFILDDVVGLVLGERGDGKEKDLMGGTRVGITSFVWPRDSGVTRGDGRA